jgi:hypothetical protein
MIWEILWFGWVLAFVIIEGIAIRNDIDGDTLSEHIRKWFRIDTRPGRTVFLIAFGGFVAWFAVHILTMLV